MAPVGTGRSLSLKLLQQLREEGVKLSSGAGDSAGAAGGGRTFREIVLQEPIRCAAKYPQAA
jgi:N-acetyltransferase 10